MIINTSAITNKQLVNSIQELDELLDALIIDEYDDFDNDYDSYDEAEFLIVTYGTLKPNCDTISSK